MSSLLGRKSKDGTRMMLNEEKIRIMAGVILIVLSASH